MNYDRGFQSFFFNSGQDTLWSLIPEPGYHHEALDVRAAWRSEADRNAPKTFMTAIRWLELLQECSRRTALVKKILRLGFFA